MTTNDASVLCYYAPEDESLVEQLGKHMTMLRRQGYIDAWSECSIEAGEEWEQAINERLDTANMILLLVSPGFMASDFCYSREMKQILERHKRGEALIIPIVLRPVVWAGAPFGHLQMLPGNGRAITTWTSLDAAFVSVTHEIRKAVAVLFPSESARPASPTLPQSLSKEPLPTSMSQRLEVSPLWHTLPHALAVHLSFLRTTAIILLLGRFLLFRRRYEAALGRYEQALRIQPHNPYVYLGRGEALLGLMRNREALAAYQEAIRLAPDLSAAYEGQGKAYERLAQQTYEELQQQAQTCHEKAKQLEVEKPSIKQQPPNKELTHTSAAKQLTIITPKSESDPISSDSNLLDSAAMLAFPSASRSSLNRFLTLSPNASVDLHMHTAYSDGRWPAQQLIDYLVAEHFDLVAVTDHDRVDTIAGVQALGAEKQLPILTGVEMSTNWNGKMGHMLCYGFDLAHNELVPLTEKITHLQLENTHEVYAELHKRGYEFPRQEEVLADNGGVLRRPSDNARLLREHNYAPDWRSSVQMMAEAGFHSIMADMAETVDAVHRSGGVCLIAHPGRREGGFTFFDSALLDQLRSEIPIDGIEVYHPYHSPEIIKVYLDYVKRHNLFSSAGSGSYGHERSMPIKHRAETSRPLLERLGITIQS